MSDKEVLSVLLTDPQETLKRLVSKAERVFRINRETGGVVLLPPRAKFTDRQIILVQLLGRYFASRLELTGSDSLSIEELARFTQLEEGSVSARLSELKKDGLVESAERGSHRVSYQSLESFGPLLEEIERSTATGGWPIGMARVVPMEETLESINLSSHTDPESIVLALRANQAFPPADRWLSADEIVSWARDHGSPMREDTVTKYTLPQDATLRPFIVKKKIGKRRLYQLSRQGLQKTLQLMADRPPEGVEGDSG